MGTRLGVVALLFGALIGTSRASAQSGFSVERYRMPPSADDGLGLYLPWTPGHLVLDARLGIDYAHAPLVLSEDDGTDRTRRAAIVEHALSTDLAVSLGILDRLAVWVALPIVLYQGGDADPSVTAPSAQALGDMEIGVRGALVGERTPPSDGFGFGLGIAGSLVLPTGSAESLSGDGEVGFRAGLVAALTHAVVTPIASLGFAYRPERTYQGGYAASELTYGVGLHLMFDPARIEAELRGATTLLGDGAFESDGTALELLVGATFTVATIVRLGAALDLGLTQAPGVPDVRVLGTVGLVVPLAGASEAGEGADHGGDGEVDEGDHEGGGLADVPHPHDADPDGDGIPEGDDFCPAEPETRNGYHDDDGCPDGVTIEGTMMVPSDPILFAARATRVDGDVAERLGLISSALRDHPEIHLVQIEGHASSDEEGNNRRALALSESRAQNVLSWLVGQGISADRLTFVGLGADQPADPEDQDKNRRVTFRVLESD